MSYQERYHFTHANLWLETLLKQFPEYDKGILYMERFCEACNALVSKHQIQEYFVWDKHSQKDNDGVDITINAGDRLIDFQVTSSFQNAQDHIQTNNRHPERGKIRIIYVREGDRPVMKSVNNLEREIIRKVHLNF